MLVPLALPKHSSSTPVNTVLAADVGATKTNLANFKSSGEDLSVVKENTYVTKNFPDIEKMIADFLSNQNIPDRIVLGVAGPVLNGKVKITNLSSEIDGANISARFKQTPVSLINDLEATAYGLAVLEEKDIHVIHTGEPVTGNIAIIAPGTGLGEAGMYWDEEACHPFPSEGGHCDFAPRTALDTELFHYLQKKYGHVSWERLISGPGIAAIYDFLHQEKGREEPTWLSKKMKDANKSIVVTENAANAAICKETMEFFIRYLAWESGNLVLKFKATGGLFIGGGIIPEIVNTMDKKVFIDQFSDFGRFKPFLQRVPVKVILNEKTAMLGAAYYGVHS